MNLINILTFAWLKTPTALQIAKSKLAEAQRLALAHQARTNYHTHLHRFHEQQIYQLEAFIRTKEMPAFPVLMAEAPKPAAKRAPKLSSVTTPG